MGSASREAKRRLRRSGHPGAGSLNRSPAKRQPPVPHRAKAGAARQPALSRAISPTRAHPRPPRHRCHSRSNQWCTPGLENAASSARGIHPTHKAGDPVHDVAVRRRPRSPAAPRTHPARPLAQHAWGGRARAARHIAPIRAGLIDLVFSDASTGLPPRVRQPRWESVCPCAGRFRGSDLAGRSGGEEHPLVLEDCSAHHIMPRAEHLHRPFGLIEVKGQGSARTYSSGADLPRRMTVGTGNDLIEGVDQALQAPTSQGCNRCVPAAASIV